MTATPMPDLAALPSDLPTVERAPVVPGGFLVGDEVKVNLSIQGVAQ